MALMRERGAALPPETLNQPAQPLAASHQVE
jgi:hypothetical protein